MADLRTRKKEKTRKLILDMARDTFFSMGYTNTTMSKIAEKADIGTGTIYNYFQSKADLFLSLLSEEEKNNEPAIRTLLNKRTSSHSLQLIHELILLYANGFQLFPKQFWREVFSAMFGELSDYKQLKNNFAIFDQDFLQHLQHLLENEKEAAQHSDLNVEVMAQCIYNICAAEFFFFILNEGTTFENCTERIKTMVSLLLH